MSARHAGEIVIAVRRLLSAEGVTFQLQGPSEPEDLAREMVVAIAELPDTEAEYWPGLFPIVGKWLFAAIAADLRADGAMRLVTQATDDTEPADRSES